MEIQPAKIADLYSKCSELAAQEEKEMERVVSTILPVLAYLNEPIALRPESLGGSFVGLRSVSLHPGGAVVTTDSEGKVSSVPFAKFRTADCLAILRDAFPELQRLVAERRRADLVRPDLSVKAILGGQKFILDMRSYRLLFSNSGGDCEDLSVSVELPSGWTKPSRKQSLMRDGRVEVDLGVFKQVGGNENLNIRFDCKDMDGRELRGKRMCPWTAQPGRRHPSPGSLAPNPCCL